MTIKSRDGESSSFYHYAIESDNVLVLVFDTGFKYGSRYTPAASGDTPLVMVVNDGEGSETYHVFYTGIRFTFGVYEFMLFLIDDGSKEGEK